MAIKKLVFSAVKIVIFHSYVNYQRYIFGHLQETKCFPRTEQGTKPLLDVIESTHLEARTGAPVSGSLRM